MITLYHGTTKQNAAEIISQGALKAGNYFGKIRGVALTPRKQIAAQYCDECIFEIKIDESLLCVDPESFDNDDLNEALNAGASVFALTENLEFYRYEFCEE